VVIEQCNWFTRIRIGGRIIGGGSFRDVWGGETEDSRKPRNKISLNFARKPKTSGRLRMRQKIENLSSRIQARGLFLKPIYAFFANFGARWLNIGEVWRYFFSVVGSRRDTASTRGKRELPDDPFARDGGSKIEEH
jgi:hypothetical protein